MYTGREFWSDCYSGADRNSVRLIGRAGSVRLRGRCNTTKNIFINGSSLISKNMNVLIRPWKPEDAPKLAAIANNIKLWNMLRDRFPHPYTLTAAEEWIALCNEKTAPEHLCIEANGAVCGGIGFIPGTDVEKRSAEIGYFVGEPFWGKGIATKAVALLLEQLTGQKQFVRIFSIVFSNNPGSMRVLQKNGFSLEQIRKKSVFKNGVVLDDYVWVRFTG